MSGDAVREVEAALGRSFVGLPGGIFGVRSRARRIAWPRQVGMAALVDQYGFSLKEAGRAVGKDHGTVRHACERVRDAVQVDREARVQVMRFLKMLGEVRS
jgi:hypothetical protein